jgi:hypothetical protein
MPKIFLFSRDPGGANTLVPLAGKLSSKGYEVCLYGKDTALDVYRRYGLNGADMIAEVPESSPETIKNFISDMSPDIIITGTSAEDFTERYIWQAANEIGIFSMAILDQWLNYGIRFSKYGISRIRDYVVDKRSAYLPSRILVMDEIGRGEAIRDGLDPGIIVVTGQPHFEAVLEIGRRILPERIRSIRNLLGAEKNDKVIVFVSEPISKDYGKTGNGNFLGYDERTVFSEVEKALVSVASVFEGKFILVVRPHPREEQENWSDISGKALNKINYVVDRESNSILIACSADLVVGMSSMLLIEAAILKKPVMSVQIGLTGPDPFILSKRGSVATITEQSDLEDKFRSVLLENELPGCGFDFITDAGEKIISLVEENLCRD